MAIEYLAGIQPGQKIDLGKFEDRKKEPNLETYLPYLKNHLAVLSEKINRELPGFVDNEGRIAIEGKTANNDRLLVDVQEDVFSRETGKTVESWNIDNEKNPSNLTEMALTVLLQKQLGDDFIVARSSKYDDYNNGVDQVIVYRPTGEVVCGFDEVIGRDGNDGSEKKKEKLERIMAKGGAYIKYGAKLEDGKLVRGEIKNVPAFFMGINKSDLRELLDSLKNNPEKNSEAEEKIFLKLLESLESQASGQNLDDSLKEKTALMLEKFRRAAGAKEMN